MMEKIISTSDLAYLYKMEDQNLSIQYFPKIHKLIASYKNKVIFINKYGSTCGVLLCEPLITSKNSCLSPSIYSNYVWYCFHREIFLVDVQKQSFIYKLNLERNLIKDCIYEDDEYLFTVEDNFVLRFYHKKRRKFEHQINFRGSVNKFLNSRGKHIEDLILNGVSAFNRGENGLYMLWGFIGEEPYMFMVGDQFTHNQLKIGISMGNVIEQIISSKIVKYSQYDSTGLILVQGRSRIWLYKFRLGDEIGMASRLMMQPTDMQTIVLKSSVAY